MYQIKDEDFPSIFRAADKASIKSQQSYKLIIGLNLCLLILSTIIGLFVTESEQSYLTKVNAILLLGSAGLTTSIFFGKFDKTWYDGRALAESIKTVTWKFMMRVDPFGEMSASESNDKFLDMINSIRKQRPGFSTVVPDESINYQQITEKMKEIRAIELNDKLDVYINQRIENQKEWYYRKSNINRKRYRLFIWLCITLEFIAFLIVIINPTLNFYAILVNISTALIGWIELKKYNELSESYAVTYHEIVMLHNKAQNVDNLSKMNDYINDAENAFSREHTLWLARRGNMNY